MTGTHAVSVEGVNFSGIFVELWKKRETELSTHRSLSGLQTIYSWQISCGVTRLKTNTKYLNVLSRKVFGWQ